MSKEPMSGEERRGDAGKRRHGESVLTPRPRVSASPRLPFRPSSLIIPIIVFVVLLYGVIYPNLYVLTASLQSNGEWSLANYRDVLSQSTTLEAAASSVVLSLLTVIFCALVGVSLAFLFERYTFPLRGL